MMNPLLIAIQGKGLQNALRRFWSIASRYGLTPRKMDLALARYRNVLAKYSCGASFPITAAALSRSKGVIEKYQTHNIEFAVHGFYHIDHSIMAFSQQISDFTKARQLFGNRGIVSSGFRSPYLRFQKITLDAVSKTGFIYDSSSSLNWDVLNGAESTSYKRVLEFFNTQSAELYPALPRIENGIVEIPYCLPDDESLIERLVFDNKDDITLPWKKILDITYSEGELFTLGLHPERIYYCEEILHQVLDRATSLSPKVWIARMDEIAQWWLQRSQVKPVILSTKPGEYSIKVQRIQGLSVLGRNVDLLTPNKKWDENYRVAQGNTILLRSSLRPFIGISPQSDPALESFLRQTGYIVEATLTPHSHSIFLDYPTFSREDEKPLLRKIEGLDKSLVRFGRWPHESKSALSITGDIDALTIWDYILRLWRK